jgi:hypothetical protein
MNACKLSNSIVYKVAKNVQLCATLRQSETESINTRDENNTLCRHKPTLSCVEVLRLVGTSVA